MATQAVHPVATQLSTRHVNEEGECADPQVHDSCSSRSKLTAEQVQRILHLRFVEHVPVQDIAPRFNRSKNTIMRVIQVYKSRPHGPSSIQPGKSRRRAEYD
jgi:hypothetical protein